MTCSVFAQDYHYSQQYAVPMLLNPSMTGYTNCAGRLAAQYRNQWAAVSEAFQTTSIAYEHTLLKNNENSNGFAGVGLALFNDMAGLGNLRQTSATASTAYHFYLGGSNNHFFSVGGQFTVGQQSVNAQFSYDAQFTGTGFSFALPSGEAALDANRIYLDVAAGLSYTLNTDYFSVNMGGAVFHIPEPDVSLNEGVVSQLPRRFAFHTNMEFPLGNQFTSNLSFIGRLVYQRQGNFNLTNLGGFLKINTEAFGNPAVFSSGGENFIYVGAMYRWQDAAVAMAKLQLGKIGVGVSYDFNTSTLMAASRSQGGFEVGLTYDFGDCETGGSGCPTF
jgi:type IX secretion system PorP/SprF family membrane protein